MLLGRGIFSEVHAAVSDSTIALKSAKPFDAHGATKADVGRAKMVARELRVLRAACGRPNLVPPAWYPTWYARDAQTSLLMMRRRCCDMSRCCSAGDTPWGPTA